MKSKTIWHVGGYNRNYGDFVLLESIRENLEKQSDVALNFVNIDCQSSVFFDELITQMNKKADMLLIGGGGFVMNRHEDNSLSGWQWNIKNEDIQKIKVPIVVYGIGYNKFNYDKRGFKENMNESLKITQNQAELFSVRNTGTKKELIKRGLDKNSIEVIPDSGMFITPYSIDLDLLKTNRMLVGLNFVSDRPHYTFPGDYRKKQSLFYKELIDVCKYLIKEENALIINIDHIPALDEDVNKIFIDALGSDNYKVLSQEVPKIYPPSLVNAHYLAYIYKKMDLVLGMRGHSNIISFGMGTPFISIGSHNKNRFFLKDIDEEDYLIDIRKFDTNIKCDIIIKKIEKLLSDKNYKIKVENKRKELYSNFYSFNDRIIDILREKPMEILDLYDDNGSKLNEEIVRGNKPDKGKNIMLSVVFIKNKDGKYLIQKTSKEKGEKFSTTGGHVIKGENGIDTIIREIKEELGIKVGKTQLKLIDTIKYPTKQCIFNIYELVIDDININDIKLQVEEVESVLLLTTEQINKIIIDVKFLESHAYIFQKYIVND